MGNKQLKKQHKRSEIDDRFKWNLEEIYQNESQWEEDFKKSKILAEQLEKFKGQLNLLDRQLLKALKLQDELSQVFGKVFVYARMKKDEDNTNSKYQALTDRAATLGVYISSITSYIVPEILSISANDIERLLEDNELKVYKRFIEEIYRLKSHVLSTEQEELLAQVGEIADASENIFGMLNNADIKFPLIVDESGEEVELTKGRYHQFMESSNRRIREDAFNKMYSSYTNLKNTFATTLNSNVKKNIFYAKARKYPSAIEASLFGDKVPLDVYNQLCEAVHENMGLMHRYVKLRKKMLNLDELHMYDLHVPIIKDVTIKITYEEAVDKVLKGLHPLGQEYISNVSEGIKSGWIDVYENEGKTSGAYSWGSYGTNPYILLNYQDKVNDMFTLAHELGHSIHSLYSNRNQPYVDSQYKIFVAEVASTLNEALLMDYLLKTTTDKKEKLYYLNYYLEQFRGTIYRQTMFAEFEKMIHEKVEANEALTPELLNTMYHDLNVTYYGPDIIVDDLIDIEWARVPHFYMNFYVYKYATGFSAAISLSKQILREGEPAVKKYLEFLKSGGSDYPIELLKKAGVDMTTKEPIQNALSVFKEILDEMETLLGN
ncbi:MAG: oligoendopeptidase F [Vulcanibacillus sp.]